MSWAAVAGAGVSAAGSLLTQSKSGGSPAMNRVNTGNAFGTTEVINNGKHKPKTIQANLSPDQMGLFNQYTNIANQGLGGFNAQYGAPLAGQIGQFAGQDLLGAYNAYQNQGISFPGAQQAYAQQNQGLTNFLGNVGAQGYGAAFGGPTAGGLTNQALQYGQAALGQDYAGLESQRLQQLRDSAMPAEQQATNAKFNSLFARGQLGTTGGAQGIQALSIAQQLADVQRQQDAGNYAQTALQNNRGFATNMFGTALSGIGSDQNYAIGLGTLGQGAFNATANLNKDLMNSYGALDEAQLSRGQSRLKTASDLFGFGNTLNNQGFANAGAAVNGYMGIGNTLNANQALTAGGNPSTSNQTGSMFGPALQGLGSALTDYFTAPKPAKPEQV